MLFLKSGNDIQFQKKYLTKGTYGVSKTVRHVFLHADEPSREFTKNGRKR